MGRRIRIVRRGRRRRRSCAGCLPKCSVLERVGIDDNFFERGGDSIVSIQLVSRARRAGLSITPRMVFQHQTVEALAAAAGVVAEPVASALSEADRARLAVGVLPATPIMRWLKERGGPLDGFSQSMLLQVPAGLAEEHLTAALAGGARSSRCAAAAARSRGAEWRLEVMPAGSVAAGACLRRIDVAGVDDAGLRELIAAETEAAERQLSPTSGVMVQALWFDAGPERAGRLWLAIHHLAVDGVSWRILVPDLAAACAGDRGRAGGCAAAAGDVVPGLGGAAGGACAGCRALRESFRSGAECSASRRCCSRRIGSIRLATRLGTAGHLTLTLPSAVTDALLTRVPAAFHGGIDDVLLTGLALAVADWCRRHVQGAPHGAHRRQPRGAARPRRARP